MARLSEIKISSLAKYHRIMYTDSVEVYRTERIVKPNGTTGNSPYKLIGEYPCKLSFGENDDSTHEHSAIISGFVPIKLFLDRKIKIDKGDKLVAHRKDEDGTLLTYSGVANKTSMYRSHQEVMFVDRSDA